MRGHQELIIPWLIAATTNYFVVTTAVPISNTTDAVVISDIVATVAVAIITIDLLLCHERMCKSYFLLFTVFCYCVETQRSSKMESLKKNVGHQLKQQWSILGYLTNQRI